MNGYLALLGKLKRTTRAGWVRKSVHDPESVAEHSFRAAAICMLALGRTDVRVDRCVQMALVHDIAESIVGDITPHDGVTDEDKHARERAALQHMTAMLGNLPAASEIMALWEEYEAASTPEARFVKQVDKLEMVLQAHEYEREQPGMRLQEFFDSVPESRVPDPLLRSILQAVHAERNQSTSAAEPSSSASNAE